MEPVIVNGHAAAMLGQGWEEHWDAASLSKACGEQMVTPKQEGEARGHHEDTWANLKDTKPTTLAGYLSAWAEKRLGGEKPYVFDWSIQSKCPAMLSNLTVPMYWSGDMLQMLPSDEGIAAKTAWPSLLAGPEGSGCGLHEDALKTNFWMMQVKGRKKWAIYPRNESFLLYPNVFTDTFAVDPFSPTIPDSLSLARQSKPWLFTLEPGELVLLPYGSPHAVRNLDDTLAIAGNYIDALNFDAVAAEVKVRSLNPHTTQPWHARMSRAMEDIRAATPGSQISVPAEQGPLPWADFKRADKAGKG